MISFSALEQRQYENETDKMAHINLKVILINPINKIFRNETDKLQDITNRQLGNIQIFHL